MSTSSQPLGSSQVRHTLSTAAKVALLLTFVIMTTYGSLTIEHAIALQSNQISFTEYLFKAIIPGYALNEPGMISGLENTQLYFREFLVNMNSHTILGGIVMILGLFQFIPGLRHKHRQLHRAIGALVLLCMLTVSISAQVFLFNTQPAENIGGTPFWFLLLGLSGFSLWFVLQAILAAYKKQFRDHMIWMGLAMSCYLTAPGLRLNYFVLGFTDPQSINRLVPNSASVVLLQTFLLFAIWLVYIGDQDLRSRVTLVYSALQHKIVTLVLAASALSIAGLLVTVYTLNPTEFVQASASQFLMLLAVFGLTRIAHMVTARETWQRGIEGKNPNGIYALVTLTSTAATLYLVSYFNNVQLQAHSLYYALGGLAIMEMALVALAYTKRRLSTGANLFALLSAGTAWMWASIPGLLVGLWAIGFAFEVALVVAILLSLPMGMVGGFIVGTQLQLVPKPAVLARGATSQQSNMLANG